MHVAARYHASNSFAFQMFDFAAMYAAQTLLPPRHNTTTPLFLLQPTLTQVLPPPAPHPHQQSPPASISSPASQRAGCLARPRAGAPLHGTDTCHRGFGLLEFPNSADSACSHIGGRSSPPPVSVARHRQTTPPRFSTPNSALRVRKVAGTAAHSSLPWRCLRWQRSLLLPTHLAGHAGESSAVRVLFAPCPLDCSLCSHVESCSNPESIFQGHSAWHMLSAGALVLEFIHVCAAFEQAASGGQRFRSAGVAGSGHLSP